MSTVEEKNWHTAWLRGGKISDLAWIGQDVLAWCSGLCIVFFDIPANKVRLPKFTNDVASLGVSCLSGHLSRRVFAFAEKNIEPKIYLYAYPLMTKISECVGGTSNAYLATALGGDYLVSLGSVPDFKLTVWSWRTGKKIGDIESGLYDADSDGQTLRLSISMPMFVAQVGSVSGRLFIWEATVCSTTAILNKNEIQLPQRAQVKDVCWCPETNNLLAITDRDGHIYLTNPSGSELKRIVLSQRCGVCIEIEPASICWYQGGIVLRTTFCQIRYYRNDDFDVWRKVWFVKNKSWPCVLTSHPSRHDRLFFATREGHVMQIKLVDGALKAIADEKYFNGGIYGFVEFVNPWGDHVVVIDASMELSVVDARTGADVTQINPDTKGKPTFMLSHPDYPIIVVISDEGEVVFVSLFVCQKPMVLVKYRLQSEGLDFMKFSSTGSYLIVGHKQSGICYVLTVSASRTIDVVSRIDTGVRIADVILFDVKDSLKLYILTISSSVVPIGYKILSYTLAAGQRQFTKIPSLYYFNEFYQYFDYASRDSATFVGIPYLTKQLRFYKISDWKSITCFDIVSSGHNLRCVKVFTDKKWLVTCGLDGSITVRDINVKNRKNLHFMTHHKCDFGVTKAVVNSTADAVIALGADGSIVGVCHLKFDENADTRFQNLLEFACVNTQDCDEKITRYKNTFNEAITKFLCEPISTYASNEDLKSLTWVEWKERQRFEEEKQHFLQEKDNVVSEFNVIKNRIVELLDKNERSFDYEKIPILEFALNKVHREKKMKTAKDEREDKSREIESNCSELERVADWIQQTYWDSQKVLAQSICGIFDATEITNYAMSVDKFNIDRFNYAQFTRIVTKELLSKETIYPWERSEERRRKMKSIQLKNINEEEDIEQLFAFDEEPDVNEEEERNKHLLEGLTTRQFIQPSGNLYSQFEIYAFSQILCDNYNDIEDCKRLRLFFNKRFNDMFSMKEREMVLVRERIDRIIHIGSELYAMFKELISENFVYPEWNPKEQPDSIIQVKDSEILAKPYISPSQQEILDKKAAEEERRRLAMLANDFYERALQEMMDGKMEIRWEDIIKRDPPKPDCLLSGKDPESFTDEDNFAIKRYEQEVKNLKAERERYRCILHNDLVKTTNELRESIDKFNSRLEEFYMLKMKVEAAIQQLNLRYLRYSVGHVNRVSEIKADDDVKMKIEQSYQTISRINDQMKIIQSVEQEIHQKRDSIIVKDKYLEKKLKSEFPTLNKNAFAVISMQFKKRPRLVLKTSSPAEVLDLAKSIISMERLAYLTSECLDYLKQLEALDIRSPNLPQSIETSHWENLIVLRRLKIDQELKQHAASLELRCTAVALDECNRKLSEQRVDVDTMNRQLKEARKERNERELNVELQLVLKMGQTEIANLTGSVADDWTNVVVVPRLDLDRVNEAVLRAGNRKIRTIERSLDFSRTIKYEQWEHQCLDTRVKHLGAELYFFKMANVTRQIRHFLRKTAKGQRDDNTPQKMERELDLTRRGQEKILNDWQTKLEDVTHEVFKVQKQNKKLNKKVVRLNVDRCDMELKRDVEGEARQKNFREKLVKIAAERSAIIRKLLLDYEELVKLREKRNSICCVGKPLPKSHNDKH